MKTKKTGTNYFKLVLRSLWIGRLLVRKNWYIPHLMLGASMTVMLFNSFLNEPYYLKQTFLWGGIPLLFYTFWFAFGIFAYIRKIENAFSLVHGDGADFSKPRLIIKDEQNPLSMETIFLKSGGYTVEDFNQKIGHISMRLGHLIESISLEDIKENIIRVEIQRSTLPNQVLYSKLDILNLKPSEFVIGISKNSTETLDYSRMVHMLVAGQTGSGKTVFLKQFITTALTRPRESFVCLIDMKGGIDYLAFEDCRNFKSVTSEKKAAELLRGIWRTFERRRDFLSQKKVDNWTKLSVRDLFNDKSFEAEPIGPIFIVIDELAELVKSPLPEAKECAVIIEKLARLSRFVGIHLVLGTQRPDKTALSMQIKDNLSTRVCFSLPSVTSSTLVVGNMLASTLGNHPGRAVMSFNGTKVVQTPLIKNDEIELFTSALRLKTPDGVTVRSIQSVITEIKKKSEKDSLNV